MPILTASYKNRLHFALLFGALGVLTVAGAGCADECTANTDCPKGQYCDEAKGVCNFECRVDKDCASGKKCSTLGRCVPGSGSVDSGPREAGLDSGTDATKSEAGPDLPRVDQQVVDSKVVDLPLTPDQPQILPDILQPDQWVGDGPKPDALLVDSGSVVPGLWAKIKGGTFFMGSPKAEACRSKTNESQHQVTLSRSFKIGTTEVTQAQFNKVMAYTPVTSKPCSNCPVVMVSWHEAVAYCNALSKAASETPCYNCTGSGASIKCEPAASYTGSKFYSCKGYRLPSEAEWEYATRGGTNTSLYIGQLVNCSTADLMANAIAWYNKNSGNVSHPVSQKKANPWGLYDMSGNVMEWVNDWYVVDLGAGPVTDPAGPATGSNRVMRGGSWQHQAAWLRSANRLSAAPTGRTNWAGFRCVVTETP